MKEGGKLYLAIENRYAYEMFLGSPDPHNNLRFTSIAPRNVADRISKKYLGRPYVNWLYPFNELEHLLKESDFTSVDSYLCFPDYLFPEKIISYSNNLSDFSSVKIGSTPRKQYFKRLVENLLFRKLKLKWLAPSIIVIAYK